MKAFCSRKYCALLFREAIHPTVKGGILLSASEWWTVCGRFDFFPFITNPLLSELLVDHFRAARTHPTQRA